MKINPVLFCISPSLYYLCSDMANDYFQFRQFTIRQERCGMKVGTDGTLLGAWAQGGKRILDIGTGTGLIALMMAQRFTQAEVVGIDIDADAVAQARENVVASPFSRRVDILLKDVKDMEGTFDSIVSNPPYILRKESDGMEKNVLEYEPSIALFAPAENPILFYEAIGKWAIDYLKSGGRLFFELNPLTAEEVKKEMVDLGFQNVEMITDQYGKQRFLKAMK